MIFKNLRQLSFSLHSTVAKEPGLWLLYQPYIFWGQTKKKAKGIDPRESVVNKQTDLVIDGFQGSANSFATVAFKNMQEKSVRLAHHLHSPSQIIKAVKNDVPVLLTVREPEAAILSLTGRWDYISVTQALKSYIGFYDKLLPYTDRLVVSTFKQTTQELDEVIERINNKYDTQFDSVNIENVSKKSRKKVTETCEQKVLRQQTKMLKRKEFERVENRALLQKAQNIYEKFEKIALKQQLILIGK